MNSPDRLADKIDHALGLHLSENESDHVYRQTNEEGLVHMFRTLEESGKTYRDVEPKEGVTGAPRKWAELLSQDYVWRFMERAEPMGIHMFDAKSDMRLHRFHATMLGTGGGVSDVDVLAARTVCTHEDTQIVAYMVGQMEDFVCRCFNDLEVNESKVDRLIAEASGRHGSGNAKQARLELQATYGQMMAASATMSGAREAVYAIRECMDQVFVQHLGPQSDVNVLFANQMSTRWRAAMKLYMEDVIERLPKVVATITSGMDDAAEGEEQEMVRTLRWCVAKVKVLNFMFGERTPGLSYGMLPFMSRSVYSHVVARLEVIDASLKEVCLFSHYLRPVRFKRRWTPPISRISGTPRNARYDLRRTILTL